MVYKSIDVLFVTHSNVAYGANRSMASLIRHQAKERNVELIGPIGTSKLDAVLRLEGVRVCELDMPWCVSSPGKKAIRSLCSLQRRTLLCKLRLARWLRNKQVRIVYSNSSTILWGAWIAKRMKAKHIWHLREFGDLDYNLDLNLSKSRFKQILGQANSIICVSHSVAKHFDVEQFPATEVVYNGVLPVGEIRNYQQLERQTSEGFRFGMIGFMAPGKGFGAGIRALARLKEWGIIAQLGIYGGGSAELQVELKNLAWQQGVSEQVQFLGYREQPRDIFGEIDCLVVAAEAEAFGRTTAEAMCYGVPVIGRASAGTAELIDDQVTGLLFRETDMELATRMAELCQRPELIRRITQAAAIVAEKTFSEEVYTTKFDAIVGKLLSQ